MSKTASPTTARHELGAAEYWDKFYKQNLSKFYKDRHWTRHEFPHLYQPGIRVAEAGCGAGNTLFPLLQANPNLKHIFAFDFSSTAVDLVRCRVDQEFENQKDKVTIFSADLAAHDALTSQSGIPAASIDIVTVIFVLSAITPKDLPQAVANIASILKPGTGRVFFRDFALGDCASQRLGRRVPGRRSILSPNFFLRGDGTQALYFDREELISLFERNGFTCLNSKIHEKLVENRKTGCIMNRKWLQAEFLLLSPAVEKCNKGVIGQQSLRSNDGSSSGGGATKERGDSKFKIHSIDYHGHSLKLFSSCYERAAFIMEYVVANQHVFCNKHVLELGEDGIASLAVARYAKSVVACTYGNSAGGHRNNTRENIRNNGQCVLYERLRVHHLEDSRSVEGLKRARPCGWDVIFITSEGIDQDIAPSLVSKSDDALIIDL